MRKFLQQTAQNRRNWKTKCVHVYNCKDLNNFFITSKKFYFENWKTTVFLELVLYQKLYMCISDSKDSRLFGLENSCSVQLLWTILWPSN